MKSRWRVSCNYVCGEKWYSVYRLRDCSAIDHSGNRETPNEMVVAALERLIGGKLDAKNESEAEAVAELLNAAAEWE